MKKSIYCLSLLVILLLQFSCKKNSSNTPVPSNTCSSTNNFSFLTVGHKMEYQYYEYFTGSKDTSYEMESMNSNNGRYEFNLTHGGTYVSAAPKRYLRECSNWLEVSTSDNLSTVATNFKTYKAIRVVGDTWNNSDNSGVYKVISTNVPITVLAGTFNCDVFTYQANGAFNVDTIYFNNSIGYIKYDGFLNYYELKHKNF